MTSSEGEANPRSVRWAWALAVLVVLGGLGVRLARDADRHLSAGREALAAAQLDEAQDHLQWAMRAQVPGLSAPHVAADLLEEIAREALARGDDPTALRALRRLRGGILGTRHLWSPFGDRLERTNRELAAVTARTQVAEGFGGGESVEALTASHLGLLQLDPTPTLVASLAVTVGFFGWIGGGFGFIFRGLDTDLRAVPRVGRRWGLFTVACFALWIVGLCIA